MIWAFVVVLALLIPILAIVLDSNVGQALADRVSSDDRPAGELEERVETLESEIRYLSESVESLREETEFVRSLIEGPGGEEERRLDAGD